ncbi:hypothetical protein [Larkinella terrae]|uniref:Uncharacterized protein n=1 Tax=Larkinella terrae TaxID=2025311 RepID=A0A7K0ETE9_9BACT|nr:hypothetical protein [Larkinella terrae]MRS65087.1 hypothetical protein [Larkinella terrae]
MNAIAEKIYKRVRQFWNDEYELNPGHRVIQSVEMTPDHQIEVTLGDFQFFLAEESGQLVAKLEAIPHVVTPSEDEMTQTVSHLAELLKNLTGDIPLKIVRA